MQKITLKEIILNALVGSIYIIFVFLFSFLSFEYIQFRIAEALLVLLLFNKRLALGLIAGTFIANLLGPFGLIDAIFGALATSLAIILIIIFKKKPYLTLIFPALTNGIVVGFLITYLTNTPFFINALGVFIGEFVVMYLVGLPLYLYINKNNNIKELFN